MPTYQLVLHLNDHRLRTGFLDRASTVTTSPSSRIISSVGVLGWLEETSFQRSSIPWTTIGLILAEGIVPALSALSPFWRKPRPSGYVPRSQYRQTVQDPWPTRDPSKNLKMSLAIKLPVRDVMTTLEFRSFQARV